MSNIINHTIVFQNKLHNIQFPIEGLPEVNHRMVSLEIPALIKSDYNTVVTKFFKKSLTKDDYPKYLEIQLKKGKKMIEEWNVKDAEDFLSELASSTPASSSPKKRRKSLKKKDYKPLEIDGVEQEKQIDSGRAPQKVARRIHGYCMSFLEHGYCYQKPRCNNDHVSLDEFEHIKLSNPEEIAKLEKIKRRMQIKTQMVKC